LSSKSKKMTRARISWDYFDTSTRVLCTKGTKELPLLCLFSFQDIFIISKNSYYYLIDTITLFFYNVKIQNFEFSGSLSINLGKN